MDAADPDAPNGRTREEEEVTKPGLCGTSLEPLWAGEGAVGPGFAYEGEPAPTPSGLDTVTSSAPYLLA